MTIWTENVQRFTPLAADRVDQERRRVAREALACLRAGPQWRQHVVELLLESVHRQLRWSGQ